MTDIDETQEPEENEEFPSNSRKIKVQEPGKVSKVITGNVIKRKKSLLNRFSETFFGEDAKSVGSYVIWDVLIPAAKNTISEMVSTGIEMILFGETKGRLTRRDKDKSYVSYSSYYNRGGRERDGIRRREESPDRGRSRHKFDEIIIESRGEAEEVLSTMVDLIDDYKVVSVADFYDAVGIISEYSDNNWGWDNLNRASITRVREGYIINLPKPIPLD